MSDAVTVSLVSAIPATLVGLGALIASLSGRRHARDASAKADGVTHELHPNSGGSLRDAVDRVEAAQLEQAREQQDQGRRLAALELAAQKRQPRGWWR